MRLPWLRFALTLALPLLLILVVGCESNKPRAPTLATEAVDTNDTIGLTFVVPDGWVLFAKANLPPDEPITHPMRLVAYQKTEGPIRSEFELYALEPGGGSLLGYLDKNPIGS